MTNLTDELIKIEKELEQVAVQNKKEVADLQAEVDKAQAEHTKAQDKVIKAKQGSSASAFSKAVAEEQTASNIVEYYTGKIEEIKGDPYITAAEYKEFTSRINNAMDSINHKASKRASELLDELKAIQSEVAPAYVKTNELLSKLQNNIYKHSPEKQMELARKTGKPVVGSELRNEYKDDTVISGIDFILNSPATKNIKAKGNN